MLGYGPPGRFPPAGGPVQAAPPAPPLSWFAPLSEPVRFRAGLQPARQQFSAFDPQPFVPFGWFEPLSEPPRKLPGLLPRQQQFAAQDTQVIPRSLMISWFRALSEPVRFLPGLKPSQQQFEGRPPQLRPTPTTFGTLSATETKDVFLAGAMYWNKVTSVEVGIIENKMPGAEIGITGPAITSVHVSISIISS